MSFSLPLWNYHNETMFIFIGSYELHRLSSLFSILFSFWFLWIITVVLLFRLQIISSNGWVYLWRSILNSLVTFSFRIYIYMCFYFLNFLFCSCIVFLFLFSYLSVYALLNFLKRTILNSLNVHGYPFLTY